MNFLAHLYLAQGDEDLMLGAFLGDFVRGQRALWSYRPGIRDGIRLHRRIDKLTDHSEQVKTLRRKLPSEFRRYSGIVIDLAFDYELARNWSSYSSCDLHQFDLEVRDRRVWHESEIPEELKRFMAYADRRGLFENYRYEKEMLFSLAGLGTRLKRANRSASAITAGGSDLIAAERLSRVSVAAHTSPIPTSPILCSIR